MIKKEKRKMINKDKRNMKTTSLEDYCKKVDTIKIDQILLAINKEDLKKSNLKEESAWIKVLKENSKIECFNTIIFSPIDLYETEMNSKSESGMQASDTIFCVNGRLRLMNKLKYQGNSKAYYSQMIRNIAEWIEDDEIEYFFIEGHMIDKNTFHVSLIEPNTDTQF